MRIRPVETSGLPMPFQRRGQGPVIVGSPDPLAWANKADGAKHAWDFIANAARWNGQYIGALANTPNWTFTRASTGYAQTSAGALTAFASGELRRTDKGVLIEGARTNLCLWSDDWTNAAWTKTNCTAALDQTGPDGVANSATSLTATAGNATVLQSITSGSATRAGSVWIKRLTGSGNVQMTLDGGTGWTTLTVTSSWTQVAITQAAVTNPNFGLRLVTNGDAVAVKFGMVESASFQSSPIPTTTASATRAADSLTVTGVTGLDYPLTLYAEFERAVDTGSSEIHFAINDGSGNNEVTVSVDSADRGAMQSKNGGVTQAATQVTGVLAIGTSYKVATRITTNDIQIARGGSLGVQDTSCTNPATPTKIYFGNRFVADLPSFGYLRRAALWTRALTDAELQAVTT